MSIRVCWGRAGLWSSCALNNPCLIVRNSLGNVIHSSRETFHNRSRREAQKRSTIVNLFADLALEEVEIECWNDHLLPNPMQWDHSTCALKSKLVDAYSRCVLRKKPLHAAQGKPKTLLESRVPISPCSILRKALWREQPVYRLVFCSTGTGPGWQHVQSEWMKHTRGDINILRSQNDWRSPPNLTNHEFLHTTTIVFSSEVRRTGFHSHWVIGSILKVNLFQMFIELI